MHVVDVLSHLLEDPELHVDLTAAVALEFVEGESALHVLEIFLLID